jgi:UDP-N-acetylglucosamine 2-epimerase
MRILVVFGTRPEIIKLGPVIRALNAAHGVCVDVFWTGQHVELTSGLLELFEISVTHRGSDVMAEAGLAAKFGLIAQQTERLLRKIQYDWVVVQGDTTSAAAAASAGFMNKVPVAHVEAGLRTGNLLSPWPEEYNRRTISLAASLHFAPTAGAQMNLIQEGIAIDKAPIVGNTVVDALLYTREQILRGYVRPSATVADLPAGKKLVLATLHRRENIGTPMKSVLRALSELGRDGDKLIILPVHMNPEVRKQVLGALGDEANVRLVSPLQYPDFVYLLDRTWVVVSDSGGVQEEAPTFGLQILIARETTERPEVITAGFGTLVGSDTQAILNGVRHLTSGNQRQLVMSENPFGRGDSALQIVKTLLCIGMGLA